MPKRTKEEIAAEKEKEKLRALRRGPDLDRFLEGKKRTFVSYAQGARIYSMNYYSFVTLAKTAGANIRIGKNEIKLRRNLMPIDVEITKNEESIICREVYNLLLRE